MSDSPPPTPEEPSAAEVPTCFRHPQREAYVRCARCNRVICPDCMREAAVGFHCVECVAEGNRTVRQARTVFGGKQVRAPYVTWTLLTLIGLGFLAQLGTASNGWGATSSWLVPQFGMLGVVGEFGVAHGEYYRLLTSELLHGGVLHLLVNGFALYFLGPQLERWLGHPRFLALWLLSALGGSVLTYLLEPQQLTVGASTALFGLFGAIFVLGHRLGLDTRFVLVLLGLNLVLTFTVPNISWTGHIGGLASGAVIALAYGYLPRTRQHTGPRHQRRQALFHSAVAAGWAVLLVALAVAQTWLIVS
ncbi:rhomboid family intramembrane serine protease [Lipingzhangella sp. LS1_29]|uniref:Rhomboid family intramembrane serine protease n=1 Tax=Lipingzhangella rawalii TaxID=2055835 RepID=A0ABU2H9X9_9ACTN|nr:rhomboid family intramembrane serine protease [Lipingzhangella rawalii]MDS1271650.1 rhomboid family intramembrane serine protease [Lipingzhangella rawalii]